MLEDVVQFRAGKVGIKAQVVQIAGADGAVAGGEAVVLQKMVDLMVEERGVHVFEKAVGRYAEQDADFGSIVLQADLGWKVRLRDAHDASPDAYAVFLFWFQDPACAAVEHFLPHGKVW